MEFLVENNFISLISLETIEFIKNDYTFYEYTNIPNDFDINIYKEYDDLSVNYILQKFNEKYSNALDEDQRRLFESVSSLDENVQSETFENERKACLKLANDFLKEAIDNDTRESLLSVKEKLLEDKSSFLSKILSVFKHKTK